MLYLTCSMIPSVDLARTVYLVLKIWVSGKCTTYKLAEVLSMDIFHSPLIPCDAYVCLWWWGGGRGRGRLCF